MTLSLRQSLRNKTVQNIPKETVLLGCSDVRGYSLRMLLQTVGKYFDPEVVVPEFREEEFH